MVEPSRFLFLPGLLLALGSCGPLDLTGKSCTAGRPCPAGWECFSLSCRLPGTGNRILNGGFEPAVDGWTATHGTIAASTPGRASPSSAQWNADGTAKSVVTLVTPPVEAASDGTWCGEAWVQTGDGAAVGLELVQAGETIGQSVGAGEPGVWTKLTTDALALSSGTLSIALTSPMDAGVRQLRIDDVALWRPTGDSCP